MIFIFRSLHQIAIESVPHAYSICHLLLLLLRFDGLNIDRRWYQLVEHWRGLISGHPYFLFLFLYLSNNIFGNRFNQGFKWETSADTDLFEGVMADSFIFKKIIDGAKGEPVGSLVEKGRVEDEYVL